MNEEQLQLDQIDLENRVTQRTAELLAANAFLREEIAERKQTEAALRESEERFRIMADSAPVMIWVSDTDARCTFVNRPWLEFTGRTLEEQIGDGWAEAIHPADAQQVVDTYIRCFNLRTRLMSEYRLKRFDDEYRWVLDTGVPRFTADGKFAGYLGSVIDITDRKQAEILGAAQRLALQMIAGGAPLLQVVEFLIGFVERQSGEALCSVLLLDTDKGNLKLCAAPSLPKSFTTTIDGMAIGPCSSSCGTAAFLKQPVVVSDIASDPLWAANRDVALSHGLHACASVPIQAANGDLLGTHAMYYRTPREPGIYDEKLILIASQLLGIAIERKQAEKTRHQLFQRLVTAQEDERRRLSRELHDQMGQSLVALKLGLKSLEDQIQLDASAKARLKGLQEITDQLAQEVHTLARDLRPTALDDFGLHTTLSNYVEEWSERSQITADFHSNGLVKQRLSPHIETAVYRIVQEALTNVVKHARASNVSVIVEYRDHRVLAIVEDDGCGFEAEAVMKAPLRQRRLGLLGMEERVALAGGTLNVESRPGAGTTVLVHLPA